MTSARNGEDSRSKHTIIANILEVGQTTIKKTHIMYKCNLSHNMIKSYLFILTESNLLEYVSGVNAYRTTEKGRKYLRLYDEMDSLIAPGATIRAEAIGIRKSM